MSTAPSRSTVSACLSELHKELTFEDLYLGSSLICNEVEWKMFGNGKQLVQIIKEPTSSEDTSPQSDLSSATIPSHPSLDNDAEQEPAVLVFVARVSSRGYFFATDGCYRNAMKVDTIKPSCLLEIPEFPTFKDDFTRVVNNITCLEHVVTTKGYEKQSVVKTEGGVSRIRLRHILFVVCHFAYFHTNTKTDI